VCTSIAAASTLAWPTPLCNTPTTHLLSASTPCPVLPCSALSKPSYPACRRPSPPARRPASRPSVAHSALLRTPTHPTPAIAAAPAPVLAEFTELAVANECVSVQPWLACLVCLDNRLQGIPLPSYQPPLPLAPSHPISTAARSTHTPRRLICPTPTWPGLRRNGHTYTYTHPHPHTLPLEIHGLFCIPFSCLFCYP
jgi:hypothetical protein